MNREFMNQKLLEERGWKFSYEFQGEMHFEKGDVWGDNGSGAFLTVNIKDSEVKIVTTDKGFNMDGPNSSCKFNGLCTTIEIFDNICSWINLKNLAI
jgi:hypothetical protein